jgi:DNA primase
MSKYSDEVIEQILESVDILEYIGKYVELKQHGKDYFGTCPFHSEETASFTVNTTKKLFFCFGCGAGSSVIDFAMKFHKISFIEAIELFVGKSGSVDVSHPQSQILSFLKKMNKLQDKRLYVQDRDILPQDIMNKYRKDNITEWTSEDISQEVLDKYDVRYDDRGNRIVFPMYDNQGQIVNIKGRTLYPQFKEMGISKYIYYYPLHNLDFLYGMSHKKNVIQEKNEVIIFEGSKSVWKLESWNIHNAVSLETSRINDHQIKLLLSLKCNIVIALDKGLDVPTALQKEIKKLRKFTNVSWICDTQDILQIKDAPCDQGLFNFLQLYEERIKI